MLTVRPLPAALGVQIAGLDLSAELDEAVFRELLAAFVAHKVMVIPGQDLEAGQFARFARRFGRPQPHILSHLRHPQFPEILPLSNVLKDGEPTGVYDGAAYWHTDMSYEEEPAFATIVYSIQAPTEGGKTCFADMVRAYEALPDKTKRMIDGLTVLHHYGNRSAPEETSRTSAQALSDEQKKAVKNVYHPLVRAHPISGTKALYGVSGSSFGIVGWPDGEAIALLDELKAHAIRPEFIYRHRYAVGDVVAWDNASTLHAATLIPPATGPADTRLLWRVSVKGLPSRRTAAAASAAGRG